MAVTTTNPMEAVIRRIGWWILAGAALGGAWFFVHRRPVFAGSLLLGGLCAWALYQGQVRLVDRMVQKPASPGAGRKVFFRYILILSAACAMISLSIFDVKGFLWGMLLSALGVMVECLVYLAGSFWKK